MGLFRRKSPKDVLFLIPIRLADEKLPRGKIRMLYCDASGKVYASILNRSVYELAEAGVRQMAQSRKPFATIGLEISPGKFLPVTVEVGPKESWALEHILEHALKSGSLPDILKQYLPPIIAAGQASREAVTSEYKESRRRARSEATSRVLNRLPYYSERDIEFSMPIYKASYRYPLIIMKRLPPEKNTPKAPQRLLILDSDGDLAIIKVSYKLGASVEEELAERERKNKRSVRAIILQHPKGMVIDYLPISQAQRKALDTITRYFEETGHEKRPISTAVKTVLIRAKDKVSLPV